MVARITRIIGLLLVFVLAIPGTAMAAKAPPGGSGSSGTKPKNAFNIMMNYELGMHCTGFEFSYCCVLPPYNSILAQVVKTEQDLATGSANPRLLEADPTVGLDFLGRPTVLRDTELDASGNFKKYVLSYWHDAQPRNDGRGAPQTSTKISSVEGNSLLMWNTVFDSATTDSNNKLIYGASDGAQNVVQGNGSLADPEDNYANAWLNHFYIYSDLEGGNPANTSLEKHKIRLGLRNLNASTAFATVLPQNSGPAFHPMGPGSTPGLQSVLTYSGEHGTVVYTQMKVLENLPVMLTSPRIWEALGLPLTPFEDSINFFGDPGRIDESTVRPFVAMKAQLHNYNSASAGGVGTPVMHNGAPVIGFGTAPIDIPNCESCHALGNGASVNSPQNGRPAVAAMVQGEIDYWNSYYNINTAAGDSDWYSRLKAAAISMLAIHDEKHGTSFTASYPGTGSGLPQVTRLGHESVMCQKCHADNVIAKVKSASHGGTGAVIPALTEAIHNNHSTTVFADGRGRDGSCQGCHPAHRSNGDMSDFPITRLGLNPKASGDNRDSVGGCYARRDVHANPDRNTDGAETPSYLNAVGQWLVSNVTKDSGTEKGIWCTNCHTQFSQELWRAENVKDHVHAKPGDPGNVREPKVGATLADVASAAGVSLTQAIAWLDPKTSQDTFAIWNKPGVNDHADANVATIEILAGGSPKVNFDGDGDPSVRILDFCTTPDCVAAAQATLNAEGNGSTAVAVPFAAATDGRDHWLSPGEPHCADCHKAPYVEQSGNINAFPPFNYPRKSSLFRYSRGHRDITCQGCHESIHGLYPVTKPPALGELAVDQTSYDQAASMNTDGSHGPLKCGACHTTNSSGVPSKVNRLAYNGTSIKSNFDAAVSWAHTFTEEADPRKDLCLNCHSNNASKISVSSPKWLKHAQEGRVSRKIMDQVEVSQLGSVIGDPANQNPVTGVCKGCHVEQSIKVSCSNTKWKSHITLGRVSDKVWEYMSKLRAGSTCGW